MGRKVTIIKEMELVRGKYITGYTVVNKLLKIVEKSTEKDVRVLVKSNSEFAHLIALLQHNEEVATVINGVPYALGGVYSGKDTGHRTLQEQLQMPRFKGMGYHPSSKGKVCKECGEKIGVNVKYKRLLDGKGNTPSLHVSHGIPAILGGSSTASNCCVECAYCNRVRSNFIPQEVRVWLKGVKFKLYK